MRSYVKFINITLLALIILDAFLCLFTCVFPGSFQRLLFGNATSDAVPLIIRLGATWGTFFLLQCMALIKWKKQPMWLPLIAGVRLTEAFADWFYLMAAEKATVAGYIILIIIPLTNISLGILFIYMYRKIMRNYRR